MQREILKSILDRIFSIITVTVTTLYEKFTRLAQSNVEEKGGGLTTDKGESLFLTSLKWSYFGQNCVISSREWSNGGEVHDSGLLLV